MLKIKSLRNALIGSAVILFAAWAIQVLGALTYTASPSAYSYVMSAWDCAQHFKFVEHSPSTMKNFLVGFGLVFTGMLSCVLVTQLYGSLDVLGQMILDAKTRRSNDIA